jgi:hypothetical protein
MATMGGIFTPDYDGSQASGFVGTIATTANTGAIVLAKYRLWKLAFTVQPISASAPVLRVTFGNSVTGHTAITPTATSPFLHSFHENFFELDGSIDSINLANLAADNGAVTIAYAILPLVRN